MAGAGEDAERWGSKQKGEGRRDRADEEAAWLRDEREGGERGGGGGGGKSITGEREGGGGGGKSKRGGDARRKEEGAPEEAERLRDGRTGGDTRRKGEGAQEEAERLLREAFELDPNDADTLCALSAVPSTPDLGFMVYGLGFRTLGGLGSRVQGFGLRVYGSGFVF